MFELEALKAKHGDCLLLHWGTNEADRHLALIDGGPNTVYLNALKPRLEELAGGSQGSLRVDLMMLSHIDDDHINGLLDLGNAIIEGSSPVSIDLLWFNSLEGLLGEKITSSGEASLASLNAVFGADGSSGTWESKVLASVPQGQQLDVIAKRLGVYDERNAPYTPLVLRGLQPKTASIAGLELLPIAPDTDAIEKLRKVWKQKRKEGITAGYDDESPYNLSSIVVVASFEGKTMLLTGDALGLHILEGLDATKYPQRSGRYHFDLIKLPHHGSRNNVTEEFFGRVVADHYLVSGDCVKFPNPHKQAMQWLASARKNEDFTISCTYDLPHMRELFGDRLRLPTTDANSVSVDLA
jgi:hypothetical protein